MSGKAFRPADELEELAELATQSEQPARAPGRRSLTASLARPLFREAIGGAPARAPHWAIAAIEAASQGAGAGLPETLRRMLEAELHADLRPVRMFRVGGGGGRAAEALRAVGARAVSVGDAIVLGPDVGEAGTSDGDRVIAHEAFHAVHPDGEPGISDPAGPQERAASAFADRFVTRSWLDPGAAAKAAVDAALGRVGVAVPVAHRDLLAVYYGEGIALTGWALGADRPGQLLAGMLAHCDHHAACHHAPARPPVAGDEPAAEQALDDVTRAAIERTTGRALGDVVVRQDAALTARGRLGEAIGKVIRLAPEVPSPDSELGRKVRLHEAAHLAQQDAPATAPTAPTEAVEADAHAVADAAERGEARAPAARADAGKAYGLGVGDVASAIGLDPMDALRRFAPGLANLVTGGFDGVMRQVGDRAAEVIRPIIAAVDIGQLTTPIIEWVGRMQKESLTFGVLTGCCECLDTALGAAMGSVQGALKSPAAQQLRQWLTDAQADGNSWLTDKIQSVTDLVGGIIDTLLSGYEALREFAGPLIEQVWTYVADALGLDKSLSPAAAVRKKVQELWDALMAELEPLRQALRDLWQYLCDETFIGEIVRFVQDCQKLVRAIQLCRQSRSRDPQVWLGILAREMRGTVFEDLITDLQRGYDTAIAVGQAIERWVVRVLTKLGVIAAWNAAAPTIAAIGNAIKAFAQAVQNGINEVKRVVKEVLDAVAKAFRDIYEALRPLLNFVVGFGIALAALGSGNPIPMLMFFLGNLWLYVVPDCYKESLCNFVLDIFIAVMEWLPATFPLVVLIRAAALGFLHTLRAASVQQKITGMDTIARSWAGDIEIIAGFVVGFFKGLWESTPGMLVQLSLWSLTAPFQALYTAYSTLADLTGTSFSALAENAEWLIDLMSRAQGVEADADGNVAQGPFAEPADADGGGTSDQTEIAEPQITEPAPAEDEDAGTSSSPNPDGDGPAPNQNDDDAAGGDDALEDAVWDPLPPLSDMGDFVQLLQRWRNGMTRADITSMLASFSLDLEEMGTSAGKRAGDAYIAAITARETPYRIGELVGTVVGFITGEVLINLIPVGGQIATVASKLPQIAKIALQAIRSFPLFVRALEALRVVIAPALRAFARFGDELARVGRAILKWFDDVVIWARAQLAKLMEWLGRNFPKLRRLLRRLLRRALGGDDLDEVAEEAAEDAWDRLESQLGAQVYTQAEIQSRLQGIRVSHPRDVQLQLRMIAHRSTWEIRATARKGAKSKSADEGRGWVVTAYEGGTPYYAPYSDWFNHWRVLEGAEDDLEDWRPTDAATTFAARYQELRTKVEREASEGQRRLTLRGVQFEFTLEDQAAAERDGDTRIGLILTPNYRIKWVRLPGPYPAEYLGARRVGDHFEGTFSVPPWSWAAHGQEPAPYPQDPVDRHPVNAWRAGGYRHDHTTVPMPTGSYTHGGSTQGWDAESWRERLRDQVTEIMEDEDVPQAQAQTRLLNRYKANPAYAHLTWDNLWLTGWDGHHIHEASWGGHHGVSNIQYLKRAHHSPYTTWWERRARNIKINLGILRP